MSTCNNHDRLATAIRSAQAEERRDTLRMYSWWWHLLTVVVHSEERRAYFYLDGEPLAKCVGPDGMAPEGMIQLLSTDYKFAVSFVILVIVLLVKPTGIFSGKSL